jgi:hypothetical protein
VTFKEEAPKLNEYLDAGKILKIDKVEVRAMMATPKKTRVFIGGLKRHFTAQILVIVFLFFSKTVFSCFVNLRKFKKK